MVDTSLTEQPRYPIRVAAERSGITVDTLRAWERRYGAVQPDRTETDRRLYSDADIRRLRLLRELATSGHGIGAIARLGEDELIALLAGPQAEAPDEQRDDDRRTGLAAAQVIIAAQRALTGFDAATLRAILSRAILELGPTRMTEDVLAPLCRSIGERWADGTISVAHEHVASLGLRNALGAVLDTLRAGATGPAAVVTTPAGERHEFGAMMAAAVALSSGWTATYLGPDLPADEIVGAARQLGAGVIMLSLVRRDEDGALERELERIREAAGSEMTILVGGHAAPSSIATIHSIDGRLVNRAGALRGVLGELAAAAPAPRVPA